MNSKDITALAAGLAAGLYTEDQLSEILGDDSLVSQIVSLAGGSVVGGIAAGVTDTLLNNDVADDIFDTVDEVVDTLNPFNW